ncbi:MAG TPA: Asp-tRNA(Asn)/Glu-tRNA(Gln) amidotransferase subunit GatA [Polyangiaceae bacterium]|nr:Asp-tRNA(Asn)/Glu-tRNA(Gln) amidotransferase subunit GatA [Polyangiaceae bacterium]
MTDLHSLSIPALADQVRRGEVSAETVIQRSLERIAANQDLNAFLFVAKESALEAARALDQRRAKGEQLGPLAGVPIGIKDALCTVDAPTTAGSRILARRGKDDSAQGWRPPYDATVVARLRAADAIVIGKTNMDEFAMGSSNENSAFGPVKNPWDKTRIPGGSSGGSAACVAARLVPGALGSDTGGSIRQPAALCGVVGVKPSYGLVSRYGLIAFASSLDQVGPMAVDVRSAARMLQITAGPDAQDSTCAALPPAPYEAACEKSVKGLRVGVPDEYFAEGLDADVEKSVRSALAQLEALGCSLHRISLPHTRYGLSTYYLVATAEASSNLARFDGVRFGLRVEPERGDLRTMYSSTRGAGFGAEVKRRIMLGTYALSAGYYDAYYRKAQQVRTLIRRDFDEAFTQVDVIASPVAPAPAFKLGEKTADPLLMYLSDVYTLPASLAGVAGMSMPSAPVPASKERPTLPVGIQLLAPAFAEERLFTAAAALEGALPPSAPPIAQ